MGYEKSCEILENLPRKNPFKAINLKLFLEEILFDYQIQILLKFVYSEKATNFCKISTLLLSTVHADKSKVEISQNFVAFSEVHEIKL